MDTKETKPAVEKTTAKRKRPVRDAVKKAVKKVAAETLEQLFDNGEGELVSVETLVADRTEFKENATKATEVAKSAIQGLELVIDEVVPKEALAKESLLNRFRLYLEGKGTWVKYAVSGIVFVVTAFTGIGAAEITANLDAWTTLITGLLSGGILGGGFLGTLFSSAPKKFNPKKSIEKIDISTGKITLK